MRGSSADRCFHLVGKSRVLHETEILPFYSHVKIDIKIQPHFADQAFFDVDDSGDRSRSISN